jgi:hypothetical protein
MPSTPKQKNKQLSNSNRETILRFADRQIRETQDRTAFDAAYEVAADAIAKAVDREYPAKDMKVLARYEMARPDDCIYISDGGYGSYERFAFRKDDKRIPLRPRTGCRSMKPLMLEGKEADAWRAYVAAEKEYAAALKTRRSDFAALVAATTNFNALVEIWPAVEVLRTEIVGASASLSVMSDEVLARIKADPALVVEEAA